MKFIKLHQSDKELLINLSNVSEVYIMRGNKSLVYFNFAIDGEQASATVDEPLDEILELIKQVSE